MKNNNVKFMKDKKYRKETINYIMKKLIEAFGVGGARNFLAHYNLINNKLINYNMYLGKAGESISFTKPNGYRETSSEYVFVSNASSISGFYTMRDGSKRYFALGDKYDEPWVDGNGTLDIRKKIKETIKKMKVENNEVYYKYNMLAWIAKSGYMPYILEDAIQEGFIRFTALNMQTRRILDRRMRTRANSSNMAATCEPVQTITEQKIQEEEVPTPQIEKTSKKKEENFINEYIDNTDCLLYIYFNENSCFGIDKTKNKKEIKIKGKEGKEIEVALKTKIIQMAKVAKTKDKTIAVFHHHDVYSDLTESNIDFIKLQ